MIILLRRTFWMLISGLATFALPEVFGPHPMVSGRNVSQPAWFGKYGERPLDFSFDSSGVSNRLITPNGDGLNDGAVWSFSNPRDSDIRGRIYDVRGGFVSDLSQGPVASSTLQWDGRSGGQAVPSGVYVYVLEGESKIFTGTVVVVR